MRRDRYYRAEIFTATGSRGHDIMGYTQEQIINDILDILDSYEQHLKFLFIGGDAASAFSAEALTPDRWDDAGTPPSQH